MPFQSIAKLLIFGGVALLLGGVVFLLIGRFFPSGLPGDIAYRRGNTSIYFPIATSIVLSIVGTIVLNLIFRFFR
jgi:hypothetical protein